MKLPPPPSRIDLISKLSSANSSEWMTWFSLLQRQVGQLDTNRKHINRIINGNFPINQRVYISGAATTAGQYTLDRWKVTGTGGITFATTANKTVVTIPSGQALQQVIEGLNLSTGTYVLSWEGTAQGKIGAGLLGASGITGAITGGTNTTIEFAPGTVANVQLELGEVATPFEYRMDELALCQRYYQSLHVVFASLLFGGTTQANQRTFVVTMRATPTIVSSPLAGTGGVFIPGDASVFKQNTLNSEAAVGTITATAEL